MYTDILNQHFVKELSSLGFLPSGIPLSAWKGKIPFIDVVEGIANKPVPPAYLKRHKELEGKFLSILFGLPYKAQGDIAVELMLRTISFLHPNKLLAHGAFPLSYQNQTILIALSELDTPGLEELVSSADKIERVVISVDTYRYLLGVYRDFTSLQQSRKEDTDKLKIEEELLSYSAKHAEYKEPIFNLDLEPQVALKAPVISLVNKIIITAITSSATDIHIEPQKEFSRVRLRIDGVLRLALEPFPRRIHTAVISRLKVMAGLNIAETRLPQDGKFQQSYEGEEISFRISTLPCKYGEKAVMRLLGRVNSVPLIKDIILKPKALELALKLLNNTYGVLIVSGPTNSGKSFTLYSFLQKLNDDVLNINTVEDPVEYALDGINQVQVIREKGLDFKRALRALLRQDPDIILIGEVRDNETASIAVEASLTGHLVLTTMHTNEAIAGITRLEELGISRYLISNVVLGVIGQRLLRRLCPKCKVKTQVNSDDAEFLNLSLSLDIYKANTNKHSPCASCLGVGYKGRVACFEIFDATLLAKDINSELSIQDLKEKAILNGMEDFASYSRWLIQEGITSTEEVYRIFPQFLPKTHVFTIKD